jgi:hypothetical protein
MPESARQVAQVALELQASNLSELLDAARDRWSMERPTNSVHIGARNEGGLQINGNPIVINNYNYINLTVVDRAESQLTTNPTTDDIGEGTRSSGEEQQRRALGTTPAGISKEGQVVLKQAYTTQTHYTLDGPRVLRRGTM